MIAPTGLLCPHSRHSRECRAQLEAAEQELIIALIPEDAADSGSAVLEVRAGTGGREAALFAADLLNMYQGCVGMFVYLMAS